MTERSDSMWMRVIDKYYSDNPPLRDLLILHSRLVADLALKVAAAHPELGLDTQFIEESAMLHDIGIFLTDAAPIHCFGKYHYICHGYLGADLLREEGLPRHALVAERHTGTGLTLTSQSPTNWKQSTNIADLKIERRLPNRVTITVVEREPAVRITTLKGRADSGRVADLEGVVFPFSSNVSALPVIREATATPSGKRLTGMAAAAVRLVEEAALPELADLSVLEVDTTHADYLLVTLGDYSRARIAWDRMCEDTRVSRTSLTNQLTRLSKAIATRVITQPTLWHATDYGSPGRVFAKDPARSAAQ